MQLIPPRGCAYVCMDRRQDAYKAFSRIKSKGKIFSSNQVKITWAPGKGMKNKEFKDYWESDIGCSFIPHSSITEEIDLDQLEEGSVIDEDSMSDNLKEIRKRQRKQKENMSQIAKSTIDMSLIGTQIISNPVVPLAAFPPPPPPPPLPAQNSLPQLDMKTHSSLNVTVPPPPPMLSLPSQFPPISNTILPAPHTSHLLPVAPPQIPILAAPRANTWNQSILEPQSNFMQNLKANTNNLNQISTSYASEIESKEKIDEKSSSNDIPSNNEMEIDSMSVGKNSKSDNSTEEFDKNSEINQSISANSNQIDVNQDSFMNSINPDIHPQNSFPYPIHPPAPIPIPISPFNAGPIPQPILPVMPGVRPEIRHPVPNNGNLEIRGGPGLDFQRNIAFPNRFPNPIETPYRSEIIGFNDFRYPPPGFNTPMHDPRMPNVPHPNSNRIIMMPQKFPLPPPPPSNFINHPRFSPDRGLPGMRPWIPEAFNPRQNLRNPYRNNNMRFPNRSRQHIFRFNKKNNNEHGSKNSEMSDMNFQSTSS